MRELRQAAAGRSQVDKPVSRDSSRISAFVQSGVDQRRLGLMLFRGVLAGTVVAQIVHIHAIGDMLDAASRATTSSRVNNSSLQWKQRFGSFLT